MNDGNSTAEQRGATAAIGSFSGQLGHPSTWTGLWVLASVLGLVAIRKGFARLGTV